MATVVFTDDGVDWMADRLFNPSSTEDPAGYVAIGSGATTPDPTQTALVSETARVAGAFTYIGSGALKFSGTVPAGTGTGTVAEVGIFDQSSGGVMIARMVVPAFTKGAGDPYVAEIPISLVDNNA